MTSLHWKTSLQNRQCHALCTLGKTSKCRLGLATYLSFGAYIVHCPMQVGTVRAFCGMKALPELIMIGLPG